MVIYQQGIGRMLLLAGRLQLAALHRQWQCVRQLLIAVHDGFLGRVCTPAFCTQSCVYKVYLMLGNAVMQACVTPCVNR